MEIKERDRLLNMPIDEFVGLMDFEFASSNLFEFVCSRQKELNDAGYKTFLIENKGWYSMDKTWYVWSKNKTQDRKEGARNAVILVSILIVLLIAFILLVALR